MTRARAVLLGLLLLVAAFVPATPAVAGYEDCMVTFYCFSDGTSDCIEECTMYRDNGTIQGHYSFHC